MESTKLSAGLAVVGVGAAAVLDPLHGAASCCIVGGSGPRQTVDPVDDLVGRWELAGVRAQLPSQIVGVVGYLLASRIGNGEETALRIGAKGVHRAFLNSDKASFLVVR